MLCAAISMLPGVLGCPTVTSLLRNPIALSLVLPAVGFTALMRASDKGHAAAAAALIEMGADVNLRWGFETPPAVPQ